MKKLLFILLVILSLSKGAQTQAQCRHTKPRCNCAFISRQKVILHQMQDDLYFWQTQLAQDRTIWVPRLRYNRIKRDMNNIRSLRNHIAEQKKLLAGYGIYES